MLRGAGGAVPPVVAMPDRLDGAQATICLVGLSFGRGERSRPQRQLQLLQRRKTGRCVAAAKREDEAEVSKKRRAHV